MSDIQNTKKDPSKKQVQKFAEALIKGEALYPVLNMTSKHLAAMYMIAHHFYTQKQYAKALNLFAFISLLDNNNLDYKKATAGCLQSLKLYSQAVPIYTSIARLMPSDPWIFFHLYVCFYNMHEIDAAKKSLHKVITLSTDPQSHTELKNRATVLLNAMVTTHN